MEREDDGEEREREVEEIEVEERERGEGERERGRGRGGGGSRVKRILIKSRGICCTHLVQRVTEGGYHDTQHFYPVLIVFRRTHHRLLVRSNACISRIGKGGAG